MTNGTQPAADIEVYTEYGVFITGASSRESLLDEIDREAAVPVGDVAVWPAAGLSNARRRAARDGRMSMRQGAVSALLHRVPAFMTCQWCGDRHSTDQLCQRAQRGMTRRSFCFLFGAGVAGAMLASAPSNEPWYIDTNFDLHAMVCGEWRYRAGFVTIDGEIIPAEHLTSELRASLPPTFPLSIRRG